MDEYNDAGALTMKIMHILPEFEEGGVERHVLLLVTELEKRGHSLCVVSHGGKLSALLPPSVQQCVLPVHRKNPVIALFCAFKLARVVRAQRWQLLHVHSRVPAWIAWVVHAVTDVPWVATAHARYSLNYGIRPLRSACAVISISRTVQEHLVGCLPLECVVIQNALPDEPHARAVLPPPPWRFLYVGRLTRLKGVGVLLEALSSVSGAWELDILGDGPQRKELESRTEALGLSEKVHFHGFCEDVEAWLSRCHLFLFPSMNEGMGLSLMQAVRAGCPVLASDIEAVAELLGTHEGLLPPGSIVEWAQRIQDVISGHAKLPCYFIKIPDQGEMAADTERLYRKILPREC